MGADGLITLTSLLFYYFLCLVKAIGEHKLDSRHVLRKEEARFLGNFDFDMRI